ncbi:hypothetical protein ULG90_14725 [Halopseudomonas pachastrellae]|nr:hypothetical protein ULG90_14725 [Halopseudomonas pachastrellae]
MNIWVRRSLVSLALLVWAAGLGWAYWWFEGRYMKSFERPAFFQAEQVAPPFGPDRSRWYMYGSPTARAVPVMRPTLKK